MVMIIQNEDKKRKVQGGTTGLTLLTNKNLLESDPLNSGFPVCGLAARAGMAT